VKLRHRFDTSSNAYIIDTTANTGAVDACPITAY